VTTASNPPAGAGVDARGVPVDDPTNNVMALVKAANERQDDLRYTASFYQEKIQEIQTANMKELIALESHHSGELRDAETGRINAIREVDTGNVARAAEVAAAQAETLRGQVASTATATATTLAAALEPIRKDIADIRQTDIADLRKAQYEQQGKTATQSEQKSGNQWLVMALIAAAAVMVAITGVLISAIIAVGIYFATH
jgi:hypothetical protein